MRNCVHNHGRLHRPAYPNGLPPPWCAYTAFGWPSAATALERADTTSDTTQKRRVPPARVDRAIRWVILQFLAHTPSLIPGETLWPIWLVNCALDRPDSSPPMSFPACARGLADSDHPRWRPAHRHDPHDLPYTLDHLTGAVSPSVSPSALSSVAGTVKLGEEPRVRFSGTPGDFLNCQWHIWIVIQGLVCKEIWKHPPGTRDPNAKSFPI
jgi:hypothetical protein